jgi:hypothetical protein
MLHNNLKKLLKLLLPITVLSILFFLVRGCEISYSELKMPRKNPTSYIFDCKLYELRDLIQDSYFDFNRALNGEAYSLYSVIQDSIHLRGFPFLFKNENINDLVYSHYSGPSNIYISKESTIVYSASFHIHFTRLGNNKTQVSIFTLKPKITVKVKTIIQHAPGFYNTYEVEPSTVEEYKILLVIGKKMGVADQMPKLLLPK